MQVRGLWTGPGSVDAGGAGRPMRTRLVFLDFLAGIEKLRTVSGLVAHNLTTQAEFGNPKPKSPADSESAGLLP